MFLFKQLLLSALGSWKRQVGISQPEYLSHTSEKLLCVCLNELLVAFLSKQINRSIKTTQEWFIIAYSYIPATFIPLLKSNEDLSDPGATNEHMFVCDVIAKSSGSRSSAVNTFNLPERAGISIVAALHTTPLISWHAFHFKPASSNFTAFYRSVLAIRISLNTMQMQERAALMLSVPTIPMLESNMWLEESWHCVPEGLVSITPPAATGGPRRLWG